MEGIRSLTALQWNSLIVGTLSWFFDSWDAFLLIYVLTDISKTFHITTTTASLALLFTYLSRWLGAIIFGSISSRWGRKKSLIISIAVFGVFTMLTGLAPSFSILLLIRFCFGIGMGGVYAAAGPLVIENIGNSVRGFASGLFMFGFYVGNTLAPLTYYAFFPSFGWRGLFIFGGISLLLIPYILLTVPESPVWTTRKRQLESSTDDGKNYLPFWNIFSPEFIGITLALLAVEFGEFFSSYPFQSLLPTFLKTVRHFSISDVALAGAMVGFGSLVGSVIGGWVSDKIGRKRTFILAYILGIVPLLIALFGGNPSLIVIAGAFQGVIAGAVGGLVTAFENEHYPTDLRSTGNGFIHNLGALGGTIGAVIASFLTTTSGLNGAIALISSFGVILGLVGIYFTKETRDITLIEEFTTDS